MAVEATAEEKKARESEIRELLTGLGLKVQRVETRPELLYRVEARTTTPPLEADDLQQLLAAGLRTLDLAKMGDVYSLLFDSAFTRKAAAAAKAST